MRKFFNDDRRKFVLSLMVLGMSRRAIANTVGCHVQTIFNEIGRDKKFAEQVRKAEANFELRHRQRIDTASAEKSYWRASAWSLERRFPDEFAKRAPRTISVAQVEKVLGQFAMILTRRVANARDRHFLVSQLWAAIEAEIGRETKEDQNDVATSNPSPEQAGSQTTDVDNV